MANLESFTYMNGCQFRILLWISNMCCRFIQKSDRMVTGLVLMTLLLGDVGLVSFGFVEMAVQVNN